MAGCFKPHEPTALDEWVQVEILKHLGLFIQGDFGGPKTPCIFHGFGGQKVVDVFVFFDLFV